MATHRLTLYDHKLKQAEVVVDGESWHSKGIFVSTRPETLVFSPQVDFYSFKSCNGYLSVNYDTRQPYEQTIELSVIANTPLEAEKKRALIQSVADGRPHRFMFFHDPFGEYEGVVTDVKMQGSQALRNNLKVELTINFQPFRFMDSQIMILKNGDSIVFDQGRLMPRFKIEGAGNVDLKTDNVTSLRNIPGGTPIIVDSIDKKTYQETGGVRIYRGDLKGNYNYPVIKSGQPITWTGNVTSVKLMTNWVL